MKRKAARNFFAIKAAKDNPMPSIMNKADTTAPDNRSGESAFIKIYQPAAASVSAAMSR